MDKKIIIAGRAISVKFNRYAVHLLGGYALTGLIKKDWGYVEELSDKILAIYQDRYSRKLKISKNSLTIEILAHVYTYRICVKLRRFFPVGVFRFIASRSVNVDCGELGHDNNRFIWDFLSHFKRIIFLFANRKKS